MLKARVEAVLEEQAADEPAADDSGVLTFHPPLASACCPHCGHTAGLALVPREYLRQTTPVRCFACHRDASASEWTIAPPHAISGDGGHAAQR